MVVNSSWCVVRTHLRLVSQLCPHTVGVVRELSAVYLIRALI